MVMKSGFPTVIILSVVTNEKSPHNNAGLLGKCCLTVTDWVAFPSTQLNENYRLLGDRGSRRLMP